MKTVSPFAVVVALLGASTLGGCMKAPELPDYDLLITGGTVYDGSLSTARPARVGVRGDRIVTLDAGPESTARKRIDATGLAVTPGFIDPHTHALTDLLDPAMRQNPGYLAQGVTTVFVGNDGAGLDDRARQLERLATQGTGTNVGFFAGHGEIRRRVVGNENREPTSTEQSRMRDALAAEMSAGALGLSTGLFYTPGAFATTEEVVDLARVAARYGGVYDTHLRSESSYPPGILGAVDEALRVGAEAGIPVHLSHLKALGRDVWGQSGDIIAAVERARARGQAVTANQYPYRASGTRFSSALVPQWARADSRETMFARFSNPDLLPRLRREMAGNLELRGGADAMLVTAGDSPWQGMTLAEIAERRNTDALSAALDVIRRGDPSIASFVMHRSDIEAIAAQPWVMTGSDGSPGHPRKYASYPKAYRDFVVSTGLLSIARFVHRSSGLVADAFGLCDRGYLAPGRKADIVAIDLDAWAPRADFEHPERLATGVVHAFVNGVAVISDGQLQEDALPGEIVDRQAQRCND